MSQVPICPLVSLKPMYIRLLASSIDRMVHVLALIERLVLGVFIPGSQARPTNFGVVGSLRSQMCSRVLRKPGSPEAV